MGVTEGEMKSQGGDTEYNSQNNQHHPFSSIGRQSSIYSLTLDEFQHTLCENGKNFGSMNMDEFLSSIWNAEENQAVNTNGTTNNNSNNNNNNAGLRVSEEASSGIRRQPSLNRQGSLTLPAPLCRKTVEEVWSEIHRGQHNQPRGTNTSNNNGGAGAGGGGDVQNSDSAPRQPTFGEMTLEDFLVKAGVVRESGGANANANTNTTSPVAQAAGAVASAHHQQQPYGMYPNNNVTAAMGATFVGNVVAPPYRAVAPGGGAVVEPLSGKRDNGYPAAPAAPAVCYGGRMVNGGGGYAAAPVSPVSPDLGTNEKCGGGFGVEMRGRKRMMDGPVEKVVERRQRRMIKNRESAARSRARKQAYTVELEAELNQLREENAQLKQALADLERRRKQQSLEEFNTRVHTKAQKAREKMRALRRNLSGPL